ncbi:MAG: hypothetical protein ABW360_16320 [Phenylobacterium sp.]
MTPSHRVTVTLDAATLKALQAAGDSLLAFKGFTFGGSGAPLVWVATRQFLTNTSIAWQPQYQAFISRDALVAGAVIQPLATCPLSLGQTVLVDVQGELSVQAVGSPGALSITNQTPSIWTAGFIQTGWDMAPAFALSLYPQTVSVIVPDGRLLLMFCADALAEGEVVLSAPADGLLVDAAAAERTVAYDIEGGWSWDGGPWAVKVAAGADLRTLLA